MPFYLIQGKVKLSLGSNKKDMKVRTIILYFMAICCISAGVSACVSNEQLVPLEEDRTIWYNPAPVRTQHQTKAAEVFPTTSTFGSYAYMVPEGKTFDANKGDGDVTVFINNEEVSYQGNVWKGVNTYYWPHYGSLTFMSYSPYELSSRGSEFVFNCDKSSGISLSGFSLPNTAGYTASKDDILITDIVKDLESSTTTYHTSGVPTLFKHRLCKVAVKASLNNDLDLGTDYINVTGIKLQNIYTKGNYAQVGGWSDQSDLKTYSASQTVSLGLTPDTVFEETLMIPQTTTVSDRGSGKEPKLIIFYTTCLSGVTADKSAELKLYSGPGSLAAWEEGKSITYYISISTKDEYIEFSGSYNAWDDAGNDDINMGL